MHFVGDFRFVIHFYPVLLAFLIFPFPRLRVNHFLGLAHKWYPVVLSVRAFSKSVKKKSHAHFRQWTKISS